MYALIQKSDNKILRVSAEGVILAESKPFEWVECPDNCNTNWTYENEVFTEPLPKEPTASELKAIKQSEIDALEAKQFMTRGEREGWLAMILAQATAQNVPEPTLYAANPFYKRLKDTETQAIILRAELKAIK
jgi:hypothetical protein